MRYLLFLLFLLLFSGCSGKESFSSRAEFKVLMSADDWPMAIQVINTITKNEKYFGDDVRVIYTPGAPKILYGRKISLDRRYMIMVMQREGRENLSIIFHVADYCSQCGDWRVEENKIEVALKKRFGKNLIVNFGDITSVSF